MASETIDNAREYHEQIIPRIMYSDESKPSFEQVWYFDFKDQEESFDKEKIKYNGTHIMIPTWTKIHAGYSKSYHSYDEHETGIVTLVTGSNSYSLVADYPKVIFVEKYHTLTYDGKVDTSRGDYIKELSEEGRKKKWNRNAWLARAYSHTIDLFLKKIIPNQIGAGIDRALSWQVRRYASSYPNEDFGNLNPRTSSGWKSHAQKAKQAIDHARNVDFEREFKKSEQHCKHFEDADGVDANADFITFPVGRPMTTFSGEMVTSPLYYLGLNMGHVTADYDEKENVLQLYYQGFSQSRQYMDPKFPGPYPSALHVSPVAEGSNYAVDPDVDGRSDAYVISEKPNDNESPLFGWSPFDNVADFTLWAQPSSERCNPDIDNSNLWEKIDLADTGEDSIFETLIKGKDILKGAVAAAPCANIWMRNDYGRGTNGFAVAEVGVWVHFLTEVLNERTHEIATAKWWDNWDCFYKNKDPAFCSQD